MRLSAICSAAMCILIALTSACRSTVDRADLLIENVFYYDGTGGDARQADLVIRNGRFESIAPPRSGTRAERVIDGTGSYVVPGLWDAHVHVESSAEHELDTAAFAEHGVTSVRDLGGLSGVDLLRRREQVTASMPKIYSSLRMLNGEAFDHFQIPVTTEEEVAEAIRGLAEQGADFVKVHRALDPRLLSAVVQESRRYGLPLTGHIPIGMDPLVACESGMSGIEHIGSFIEAWLSIHEGESSAEAIDWLLSEDAAPLYECLRRREVFVTPTLVIYPSIARRRAGGDELPPEFTSFIEGTGRIVRKMWLERITLLAGTDTSDLSVMDLIPGDTLLDELALLQRAGIPARAIIPVATRNPARFLGVEDRVGTIAAEMRADLVLLSSDPGRDIESLRSPSLVMRGGKIIWRAEID